VLVMTCSGNENGNGGDGGDRDGTGQDGNGGDTGADGKRDGGGGDRPICNEEDINASPLTNILLVVDKSKSMEDPTSVNNPNRSKAEDLVDAVRFVLDTYQGKLRFGWLAFPNQTDCDPGVVSVPVGDDSAGSILGLLDGFYPWGMTPTGESLQNADSYYTQLGDTERANFVVLVTDGLPTCPNGNGVPNDDDNALALAAVQTLFAHDVGTFVIGLGENFNNSNPDLLNNMADAGGHPRAGGAEKYYPADNQADLEAAFRDIAKVVMSCHLDLESWPDEPDFLWVYFDGQPISRDRAHLNGFDYDETNNRIDFYGEACDKLKNGEVVTVEVKMGCAPPD
jgi:hypothetical protein